MNTLNKVDFLKQPYVQSVPNVGLRERLYNAVWI